MATALRDTYEAVMAAEAPVAKWRALTSGLAAIGLDQVNYAFLDFSTYDRMEARGDPGMSTMRQDWIAYYADRKYDLEDDVVAHVRAGRFDPKFYRLSCTDQFPHRAMAEEAREAGLKAGLLTPLPGPWGDRLPAAGIVMGSSLNEAEVARIIRTHAPDLIVLGYLLHGVLSGELLRKRAGVEALTVRERDCLTRIALGSKISQVADQLQLADVTVSLHLRNARHKLGARTLAEAVAKAMIYQQIHLV